MARTSAPKLATAAIAALGMNTAAAALNRAKKPHRAVLLDDVTHQFDRKSDRVRLFEEIEAFLHESLGPGSTGS